MKIHSNGFTLAELLIALALLGIIAAFTIPKVLQSSAEQETTAKLRETVATLESAWYTLRATNQVQYGQTLQENLLPSLNVVLSGPVTIDFGGGPLTGAAGHPCTMSGLTRDNGYVQFANGVVIGGMNLAVPMDSLPPLDASHDYDKNYVLCIDVNGRTPPNQPGQDVFVGNFNQYGAFQGVPASEQATLKSFHWGHAGSTPDSHVIHPSSGSFHFAGAMYPELGKADTTLHPCAVAGCRLTQ